MVATEREKRRGEKRVNEGRRLEANDVKTGLALV
jgi:hypothetical protein